MFLDVRVGMAMSELFSNWEEMLCGKLGVLRRSPDAEIESGLTLPDSMRGDSSVKIVEIVVLRHDVAIRIDNAEEPSKTPLWFQLYGPGIQVRSVRAGRW